MSDDEKKIKSEKGKLFNVFKRKERKDNKGTEKKTPKKIKKTKQSISKKNKPSRSLKFSKASIRRYVTLFIFLIILASLFFNIIFFSKYQTIRNSVKAQQSDIEKELGKVNEKDILNPDSAIFFTKEFLKQYIAIPEDNEDRDRRKDILSGYFVNGFNLSGLEDLSEFDGKRELTSLNYIKLDQISNNQVNVFYQVNYRITETEIVEEVQEKEVEKEVKDKKGKKKKKTETIEEVVEVEEENVTSKRVYFSIPVVTDGNGFSVINNPSIINLDYADNIDWENDELDGQNVNRTEKESIGEFLITFFESYGISDEQLAYMTNAENGLTDQIYIDSTIFDIVLNNNENYYVIIDVSYKDKDTNLIVNYRYYLELSQQRNTYFVENITQGGFQ